jgi:glucokinase
MPELLAGDIGGTKTTLRLVRSDRGAMIAGTLLHEARYPSADYPDLVPIVRRFLSAAEPKLTQAPRPAAACFGIAGPIADNACKLTNLTWSLSGSRLEHELDIPQVHLINDFAAIGHGVPALAPVDLHTLQPGQPDPTAPIAIIGAGTGLGEGFLIPDPAGGHQVFGSEGAHVDFAPRSQLELELMLYLRKTLDLTHVSVERVVSGLGITSIYAFLRSREPSLESPAMAEAFAAWERQQNGERKTVDLAAEIGRAATARQDCLCVQTMKLFVESYGAEAGNLALKLLPRGGLYVAGGIAPKILPLLRDGGHDGGPPPFLEAFLDKGRMRGELARIPVHVVLNANVGLLGAALHAADLLRPSAERR